MKFDEINRKTIREVEDYDLVGAEYAELNHADFGNLRWRVRESNIHGDRTRKNPKVSARES